MERRKFLQNAGIAGTIVAPARAARLPRHCRKGPKR